MTLLDSPLEARLRTIERDIAVIKATIDGLDKRIPSPWLIVGLILPLYGLLIFGFAGVFYFLLSRPPGGVAS